MCRPESSTLFWTLLALLVPLCRMFLQTRLCLLESWRWSQPYCDNHIHPLKYTCRLPELMTLEIPECQHCIMHNIATRIKPDCQSHIKGQTVTPFYSSAYTYVCICMCICVCIYVQVCVHVYVCMLCICVYECICIYMYVCVYVYMFVYVCMYIFSYIIILNLPE